MEKRGEKRSLGMERRGGMGAIGIDSGLRERKVDLKGRPVGRDGSLVTIRALPRYLVDSYAHFHMSHGHIVDPHRFSRPVL